MPENTEKKMTTREGLLVLGGILAASYVAGRIGGRAGARIAIKAAAKTPITIRLPEGYSLVKVVSAVAENV